MKTRTNMQIGLGGALATAGLALAILAAGPSQQRVESQAFMRQKLMLSQGVLEGLTLEKFDLVSKNAVRLHDMSQSNLWFTIKHPDYLVNTTNYQKSINALYLAAVDKNLPAATEAYTKVTRSCVECHRLVRLEQRKVPGVNPKAGE